MISQKDFFIDENIIKNISESEYSIINHIIEDVNAIARTTYRSIYIIDYYRQNFMYVSDNPLFLCGLSPKEVKDLGYGFYLNHVPSNDLNFLIEVNRAGFEFITNIPIETKRDYTLSYDFNIIHKCSKRVQLINHQITPLRLTSEGKVWLALCVSSIASGHVTGNIIMSNNSDGEHWNYDLKIGKWIKTNIIKLKDREKEILKLSAMGFTMKEIAVKMGLSFDTIKLYRKGVFKSLGVHNISEAINYAKIRQLI